MREKPFEALHLLVPVKSHELACDGPVAAADRCPEISGPESQAAEQEGLPGHLIDHPGEFPEGMVADGVVFGAEPESGAQRAALRRAHLAMVDADPAGCGSSILSCGRR